MSDSGVIDQRIDLFEPLLNRVDECSQRAAICRVDGGIMKSILQV